MFSNWKPENDSQKPIYEQLADYFKALIKDGSIVDGYKLPSQRDLCNILDVSRPTISKVFELLDYEHLIRIEAKKRAVINIRKDTEEYNPINWTQYSESSFHIDNSLLYKDYNIIRSEKNLINLFECYFGHDLHPYEPLQEAFSYLSKDLAAIDHRTCFDVRGILSLRRAICDHLRGDGIDVTPSQVLICNSLENAYMTIFEATLNLSSACYIEEESIFHADNYLRFIKIPLDNEGMIPMELRKRIKGKKSGMLFIDSDYAMPTGIIHSKERRKELLKISYEHQLPIVECPAVRDCWHTHPPHPSLKAMDRYENVIYIFSLARPFMNPLLTAIIAPEAVMPSLISVKLVHDEYTDIMSQLLLENLLSKGIYSGYMNGIRPQIINKCSETDAIVRKHFDGIGTWQKPDSGVSFRVNFDFDISRVFKEILSDGILVYPPEVFGSSRNFLWFNYVGLDMDLLDETLGRVASHIKKYAPR